MFCLWTYLWRRSVYDPLSNYVQRKKFFRRFPVGKLYFCSVCNFIFAYVNIQENWKRQRSLFLEKGQPITFFFQSPSDTFTSKICHVCRGKPMQSTCVWYGILEAQNLFVIWGPDERIRLSLPGFQAVHSSCVLVRRLEMEKFYVLLQSAPLRIIIIAGLCYYIYIYSTVLCSI